MENSPKEKLTWSALEYEEKERENDWFWALGIIVVTSAIAAMIFGDYFFALLLLLAGGLLYFFSIKKPEVINYELNDKGLLIGTRLYPFESIVAFWVQADFSPEPKLKPLLFVRSHRFFMPILSIPINIDSAEDIYNVFANQNIPEVEMREHPSEKIMEYLGF